MPMPTTLVSSVSMLASPDPDCFDLNSTSAATDVDKLTFEIFSILENKFLFGYNNDSKPTNNALKSFIPGRVRILSIDAAGSTHGILAAKSLLHLESTLRRKSGNPNAHLADFFDVVAGAGAGGLLAALLFSRGRDGRPLFTAHQALHLVLQNAAKFSRPPPTGLFRQFLRPSKANNFRIVDVCRVMIVDRALEMRSTDRRKKMAAVGGGEFVSYLVKEAEEVKG